MTGNLDALLHPESVALIGASANPAKLSNVALSNLKRGKFRLYPVNPNESEILGLQCYHSILDIPGEVDLAMISLPAEDCLHPLKECVVKHVKVAIVTASGFRESGPNGAMAEEALVSAIRGSGTRLLGPNTMGVLVPRSGLDSFFIPRERSERPEPGSTAILSQSGAVSVSSMEKARASGVGISACVGLGNKADINEMDLLELLKEDPETNCIAMYLESFSDGRSFVARAREVTSSKPIVLLKSGRTRSGARAAASHTGAVATTSDSLVDGALSQAGVLRVYDEEELVDTAKALSLVDRLKGDRICVVASAGGYGVIACDLIESEEHGASMRLARLTEETRIKLTAIAPGYSSVSNPVDLTASVTDDMYDSVLAVLQDDPNIDGILMSLELQPPRVTDKLLEIANRRSKAGKTPIVVSVFAGDRTDEVVKSLGEQKVLAYQTIWRAVRAMNALARRGKYLRRLK